MARAFGVGMLKNWSELKGILPAFSPSGLQGRPRARTLLLDWLIELAGKYHAALHVPPTPPKSTQQLTQLLLRSTVSIFHTCVAQVALQL